MNERALRARLPIALVALVVVYPFWKYLGSMDNTHFYCLGSAAVVVIYLFLWTHKHGSFLYFTGALLVWAAIFLLGFGKTGQTVNLFLVVVGALIIASQIYPRGAAKASSQAAARLT